MRDDQTAKTIFFKRIPEAPEYWRASLVDAEHIGGTGKSPEEAVGWMVLSYPSWFGIGAFNWWNRPPKLYPKEHREESRGLTETPLSEDQRRAVELVAGPDLDEPEDDHGRG